MTDNEMHLMGLRASILKLKSTIGFVDEPKKGVLLSEVADVAKTFKRLVFLHECYLDISVEANSLKESIRELQKTSNKHFRAKLLKNWNEVFDANFYVELNGDQTIGPNGKV